MSLDLMMLTNDVGLAKEAQQAGVDRIFLDFERLGKEERQGHLDSHITDHSFSDIQLIREEIGECQVLSRVNPINPKSEQEINRVIELGSDVVMLPMFETRREVEEFIDYVDGRSNTCLLLETPQALVRVREITEVSGIDEVHIGLNDLHIGLGLDFMFELLSGGIVEYLATILEEKELKWGFGGIARIGEGTLPAERILAEHVRLGSQMVILSRAFYDYCDTLEELHEKGINLEEEVQKLRETEDEINQWSQQQFLDNKARASGIVNQIIS